MATVASDSSQGPLYTIAGAGLAGTLLAVLLARAGLRVRLLERRGDLRRQRVEAGRSINLALAARGMRALQQAGMLDAVLADAVPMRARAVHDPAGQVDLLPYAVDGRQAIHSVHRGRLNQRLLDAAQAHGAQIRFDSRVVAVSLEQRRLLLEGPGGQRECLDYEVLIGADGAGSAVRDALDAQAGTAAGFEPLAHSYKELQIDPDAQGNWRLEASALHIWPRHTHMMIALPNPDGSFTATVFLPSSGPGGFTELNTPDAVQQLFQRDFADAIELVPDYATQFFANPTGWLGTLQAPNWRWRDQVLLIGDAAHAIVPFHGQGMNCAFEDCSELLQLLSAPGLDRAAAFASFEQQRRPNALAIARMAVENYLEMRDDVASPRFRLRKALERELSLRFPEHFQPRYTQVTFMHLPYAQAQQRGSAQAQVLDALLQDVQTLEQVDWSRAAQLVQTLPRFE